MHALSKLISENAPSPLPPTPYMAYGMLLFNYESLTSC